MRYPPCRCFDPCHSGQKWSELEVHEDDQDETCAGWIDLLTMIDDAVRDRRSVFAPKRQIDSGRWGEVVTLPKQIARLKNVRQLILYGSNLSRIPPEIGEMDSLTHFVPYTSYRLHWFPYEITRCQNLQSSTISTRALYGNYKYRPPFPSLRRKSVRPPGCRLSCAICRSTEVDRDWDQRWISLPVGTDVVPLLANICSEKCLRALPSPPSGYIQRAHKGGLGIPQPAKSFGPPIPGH